MSRKISSSFFSHSTSSLVEQPSENRPLPLRRKAMIKSSLRIDYEPKDKWK
ncbi:hypothetical protein BRYFOR_06090 [Marvinbryantia formatexigens DSM 14469]|uniref:Uncharacterized protein n=1 Tax=Marvinbryantia formatexigens DSM 14469 TaxID=478749 RepID=C6LBU6_9FIRM|nr:hypothetical protein BRYFOR_06090 [Marvinbryantia formatexigens DSM 14469]